MDLPRSSCSENHEEPGASVLFKESRLEDATWELLLDPPEIDRSCRSDGGQVQSERQGSVESVEYQVFRFLGNLAIGCLEDRSSLLGNILVHFLSTAVSEDGSLRTDIPLAAWMRFHLKHLSSPLTPCAAATPLSPPSAPFPLASFAEAMCGLLVQPVNPQALECGTARSKAKLDLAFGKEFLQGAQMGQPVHKRADLEFLCNQIAVRSLLSIMQPLLSHWLPMANDPSASLEVEQMILALTLLAATLARLLNSFSELSMERVVEGAIGVLGVAEAPSLVADMFDKLHLLWNGFRLMKPDAPLSGTMVLVKEHVIKAMGHALLSLRYLAAAGAGRELAGNDGMLDAHREAWNCHCFWVYLLSEQVVFALPSFPITSVKGGC